MATDVRNIATAMKFKAALNSQKNLGNKETLFCNESNLTESLSILSEELDSLGIEPITTDSTKLQSQEEFNNLLIQLINASWKLVRKYRTLTKSNSELKDIYSKILNDNTNLQNRVSRLKDELQKQQHALCQVQERERKLRDEYGSVSRDLKQEKNKVIKLRKQSLSKDSQHEHELRRITQTGHKLQDQLQKSIGTYVSRDKGLQKIQAAHEEQIRLHKQTICRLEENNRLMLQELNDLKNSLSPYSVSVDL